MRNVLCASADRKIVLHVVYSNVTPAEALQMGVIRYTHEIRPDADNEWLDAGGIQGNVQLYSN